MDGNTVTLSEDPIWSTGDCNFGVSYFHSSDKVESSLKNISNDSFYNFCFTILYFLC